MGSSSPLPPALPSQPWAATIILSVDLPILALSYKLNHVLDGVLRLASFTWHMFSWFFYVVGAHISSFSFLMMILAFI